MIFVLDNYDSFTYNLVQYIGVIDPDIMVVRNDQTTTQEVMKLKPRGIIISPGPKMPKDAGISLELIRQAKGKVPVLGVCLGHQAIGEVFGARTVPSKQIVHGKSCIVKHNEKGIFKGIESPVEVTRYHSLMLEPASISPKQLQITAQTEDGLIMGLESVEYPEIWGVQFHPESILTQRGPDMMKNFYDLCTKSSKMG